jgi:hypothetical protein
MAFYSIEQINASTTNPQVLLLLLFLSKLDILLGIPLNALSHVTSTSLGLLFRSHTRLDPYLSASFFNVRNSSLTILKHRSTSYSRS